MDFIFSLFSVPVAEASLDTFIQNVNSTIINPLIVFLFALALAYFLFGVLQFLMNPDNEEAKTNGRQHMIWGIIGLTIMMGVFAILNMIMATFEIKGINVEEGIVDLPEYNP